MNKTRWQHWLKWISVAFYALFFSFSAQSNPWQLKYVLVLHSYEASYQWTHELQKVIDNTIAGSDTPIKLSIEYLDTKRVYGQEYLAQVKNYFDVKYRDYPFDAVIVTDDNALVIAKYLTNIIRPDTPVIAVGINDQNATLDELTKNNVVIYEKDDVLGNLKLIRSLRPKLQKLYYLSDQSNTSQLVRSSLDSALTTGVLNGIELIEINDLSLADTEHFLASVSADDAVLLSHFNTELKQGILHTYQEISYRLSKVSAAPIFVMWEFYIRDDILGGYVSRSEKLGLAVLSELDRFIPLALDNEIEISDVITPVFNYHALKKHHIDVNDLPKNAVVINRPLSYLEQNWQVLVTASGIILGLLIVIIMQSVTLKQKRELARKNRKIVALQSRTLTVQREMIHLLGEAIETRSGETGNHVKRVAKLSALLAKLCGLTHREVEMIEIISPMHDVGKIAIPEAILDKPGKLNPEEWRVMQSHTTVGFNILNTSDGDITKLAAIIAHEHHERWDGDGYPNQKKGEEIHLFARITAIADVFDALLSERCYKEAWPLDKVVSLFKRECGFQFDPALVELLLDHLDDFVEIRNLYPDTPANHLSISLHCKNII